MGIFPLSDAIQMAKDRGLDLIQVTQKVDPPICRIMDHGKHLYWEKKKEKEKRSKIFHSEVKGIRLKFGMSPHDMEVRAKSAIKFLEKGHRVKIEMLLRGRQKAHTLSFFAKEKIEFLLKMIEKEVPLKIERELKKEGRGLTILITKIDKKPIEIR